VKNLLIALAIVFGLCIQSATAQTAAPQTDKEKMKAEVVEQVKAELAKIATELQLTEPQKAQIKTILTEQHEKIQAIREDSRGKMRAVLTPEQLTKWEKMKAERAKTPEPMKEMK
jgi:periplasmic protein CpxP/Spy